MNKLEEMIADLEAKEVRGLPEESLLQRLREKQEMLGIGFSEKEADEAVAEAVMACLVEAIRGPGASVDENEADVWDDCMEEAVDVVRRDLRRSDWKFWEYTPQNGVRAIEMGASEAGKHLQIKIFLEGTSKTCRIDAVYPFRAEKTLVYPLCERMMTECACRRYGALYYDERDGELSYRYSFPITHGLHEDDFRNIFMMVMMSAYASFDEIRQCVTGRFSKVQRNRIIRRAQELIIEMDR